MSENIPHALKTVVVPVARPDTARQMLKLATKLVDPEKGRVIALMVALDSGEQADTTIQNLSDVIDELNGTIHTPDEEQDATLEDVVEAMKPQTVVEAVAQALPNQDNSDEEAETPKKHDLIQLVTRSASSVTRGVLDATREYQADLLIMGVYHAEKRQVRLGTLVENVIQNAPCDVVAYRSSTDMDYARIVVPIDGSDICLNALRIASLMAYNTQTPLTYVLIQRDYNHTTEYQNKINDILSILDDEQYNREIATGSKPAEVMLRKLTNDDLLVLGFTQKVEFDNQINNDLSDVLLNRATGPVLMASQLNYSGRVGNVQRFMQRYNLTLTAVERNELIWQARQSVHNNIDYISMIILSAGLASLGLLLNSAAVIIGAMLVAPLMTPLAALSTGLVTGSFEIQKRGIYSLLEGVGLALLVSMLIAFILPIDEPTGEMLARGNPGLLDAAVALVSGWVGAYATARKDIPAALAGVAIAAALMPPVCTVGLAIAIGNMDLAFGSFLLVFTNMVFIVGAQSVVFLWFGMRPGRRQSTLPFTAFWWSVLASLGILVVVLLVAFTRQATDDFAIQQFLQSSLPNAEYVSLETDTIDDNVLNVIFTIRSDEAITPRQVRQIEADLVQELDRAVSLELAVLQLVRPESGLRQIVKDTLEGLDDQTRMMDLVVEEIDGVLWLDATIRTPQIVTSETVQLLETSLIEILERDVHLRIVNQRVINSERDSTASGDEFDALQPESTPESTGD